MFTIVFVYACALAALYCGAAVLAYLYPINYTEAR